MQNAGLDEAQAGIKTAGRNINNLRYADDIILTAESEEELKRLLMKVKQSEKADIKLNNKKKTKIPEKHLLLDLHTGFSGGRSGGLVFPSLEEFSTVCCDQHKQRL